MEEGRAGKDADKAVKEAGNNDQPPEPGRGMAGSRCLEAFNGQLQEPRNKQGATIGADQGKGSLKIASPVLANVAV